MSDFGPGSEIWSVRRNLANRELRIAQLERELAEAEASLCFAAGLISTQPNYSTTHPEKVLEFIKNREVQVNEESHATGTHNIAIGPEAKATGSYATCSSATATPRTDAVAKCCNEIHIYDGDAVVPADFARDLERELTEARERHTMQLAAFTS